MKKGMVDVQFNWIFILITGFVIFLFIISIVINQKSNADKQLVASVITQLSTILSGNVYSEISLTETAMVFDCNPDTQYFNYKISNSQRIELPLEIIFTRKGYTGSTIQVWSQDFNLPFSSGRFLYLTSKNSPIWFYNSTSGTAQGIESNARAKQVFDQLPSNMTKRFVNDAQIETLKKQYAQYRIVCFSECPIGNSYVKIIPDTQANIFSTGTVQYVVDGTSVNTAQPYLGKEGVFGAVFSEDANFYRCQMSRAFTQWEIKRTLVEQRVTLLEYDLLSNPQCSSLLLPIKNTLTLMKNPVFDKTTIDKLYQYAFIHTQSIRVTNNDLRLQSCPTLY